MVSLPLRKVGSGNDDSGNYFTPPPPPPPPPPPSGNNKFGLSPLVIVLTCGLVFAFLLITYYTIFLKYSANSRRRRNQTTDQTHEDFLDENHGPLTEVDHHIWLINTVGFPQSVIDSIEVFKYKKDEGLTYETECSVCLNEFQDDESLRLLPKCSHAFHIPCIDTWLRSHKNCPLCRAPILSEPAGPPAVESEANSGDLGSTRVETFDNSNGESSRVEGDHFSTLPIDDERVDENTKDDVSNIGVRSISDLGEDHSVAEELLPIRRSVSMDSSSASMIYLSMSSVSTVENEGNSSTQLVQVEKLKLEPRRGSTINSSLFKIMQSSSFGRSLQKQPLSMKRSLSAAGKLLLSKHRRSQTSILPL